MVLHRIREAVVHSDWRTAGELAASLNGCSVPSGRDQLGDYLEALKETLIFARMSRADTMTTLARLRAASRFAEPPDRQNPGVSASF